MQINHSIWQEGVGADALFPLPLQTTDVSIRVRQKLLFMIARETRNYMLIT